MCRYHGRYQPLIDAATALCQSDGAKTVIPADTLTVIRDALHAVVSQPEDEQRHYAVQWVWPGGEVYRQGTVFLTDAEAGKTRRWLEHHRRILNIDGIKVMPAGTLTVPVTFDDMLAEWSTFFVAHDESGQERYLGELIESQTYFDVAPSPEPAHAAERGRG